jgi:enediyne biosynthesis protein E4
MRINRARSIRIIILTLVFTVALLRLCNHHRIHAQKSPSQQPPSQPPRTGRAYSGSDIAPPKTAAPTAPSPVTFDDIAKSSGIAFKHAASQTSQKYLPESMGAGVAMLDYDGDGRMDLFFTNGARLDDPMPKGASPDKRDAKYWNRLYHQKADGTFEDVTERAGVRGEGYSMGATAADYDNDGWVDLYVTGFGANILYHNNGDGSFADVSKKTNTAASGWSTSAAWLDYDGDGRLDLFVGRYLDWDFERGALLCGDPRPGFRAYCHPNNFKGVTNVLLHQKADGTFEDSSVAAKIADPSGKALGVAIADIDNDGWPDIIVANDSVRQSLYRNLGNGTFADIALPAGIGYDENGKTFAGMGIDAADYDDDGYADIFITALSSETYPLYHNSGDSTFTYDTGTTGIAQATLLYSGWGTRFVDVDNDRCRDLFVAQGHVLDTIEKTSSFLKYKQPPLLLRNTGNGFITISPTAGAAFTVPIAARGAAVGDLNNDGQPDLVLGVLDDAPVVLRNNGTRNHWIGFALIGTKSNRTAIGARLVVTDAAGHKHRFEVTTAGSYLSSSDPRIIVGLGAATGIRSVEIRWPSKRTQTIENLAVDRYHTLTEK